MTEKRDKNGLTETEFLAAYRPRNYPRPSVTADIAVFRNGPETPEVLLIRRGGHPFLGCWALPGGFSKENESVDDTAARELYEETRLKDVPLEQIGLFSAPGRDPRMWVMSEAYAALLPESGNNARAGDDAAAASWFQVSVKEADNLLCISFQNEEEIFSSTLEKRIVPAISGTRTVFSIRDSGGLAFDHALILAYTLQKLGIV